MKRVLMLLVLSTSLCGLAKIAAAEMAKAGQWEIGAEGSSIAGGSFSAKQTSGADFTAEPTTTRIRLPVGYFITDAVEVGGSLAYDNSAVKVSAAGVSTTVTFTSMAYSIGAAYNFHPRTLIPFIGAEIGARSTEVRNSSKNSETATVLGVGAGIRVPLADQIALRLSGRYDFLLGGTLDINGALIGGQTGNGPGLNLGFSFFF